MKVWVKIILAIMITFFIWFLVQMPSNDRNWEKDQKEISWAEINGPLMSMHNIRNISYRNTTDYDVAYYDKTFNIEKLDSVYFMVEPFAQWEGAAHTFLSFGFGDEYLVISIEIRKEVGEEFSIINGMLKQYELQYVFGDENDLIKLRSNYRHDDVYLFPIKTEKEKIISLFLDMINKANYLKDNPEFYNTVTSSCTTNIVDHVNKISPKRISFDFRILAPGYSGMLAHEVDLIDTELSWEEAKEYFKINERALKYANDPEFSKKIREYGS